MVSNQRCDECEHYIYDEEWDCYDCEIDLDMDDRERMSFDSNFHCPYYRFYDEYRIVRKQN